MSDLAVAPGLFDRAIRRVASLWREMAGYGGAEQGDGFAARMRACLEARGGEVSARARAAGLAESYLAADRDGRAAFLRALASFVAVGDAVTAAWHRVAVANRRDWESANASYDAKKAAKRKQFEAWLAAQPFDDEKAEAAV